MRSLSGGSARVSEKLLRCTFLIATLVLAAGFGRRCSCARSTGAFWFTSPVSYWHSFLWHQLCLLESFWMDAGQNITRPIDVVASLLIGLLDPGSSSSALPPVSPPPRMPNGLVAILRFPWQSKSSDRPSRLCFQPGSAPLAFSRWSGKEIQLQQANVPDRRYYY